MENKIDLLTKQIISMGCDPDLFIKTKAILIETLVEIYKDLGFISVCDYSEDADLDLDEAECLELSEQFIDSCLFTGIDFKNIGEYENTAKALFPESFLREHLTHYINYEQQKPKEWTKQGGYCQI